MTSMTTTAAVAPARTGRNLALGVAYLLLAVLGVALLRYAGDRLAGALAGALLLLLAVAGLVLVGFDSWYVGHRPGVRLAPAPSGAPATAFPRSPLPTVMSAVLPAALAVWALTGCVLAASSGRPLAAVVLGLLGIGVATPLVAAVRGRVAAGGLYLTATGVEHRKEAVTWAIPWEEVTGVVPGDPLALTLRGGAPEHHATTRVLWQREISGPPGTQGVDSRYLAEDPGIVAAVIARCLVEPDLRGRMGTESAVAEIAAQTRSRSA
jgi:hypothetical protein